MEELKKYEKIINDKNYQLLKDYIAHGQISVYEHSLNVASLSIAIDKILGKKSNIDNLVIASLLHDFYLYDWHNASKELGLHGYVHSQIAANNAIKYFNVNKKIVESIESHMWPLNITKIPHSREALIICLVDKICAIKETIFNRKRRRISQ